MNDAKDDETMTQTTASSQEREKAGGGWGMGLGEVWKKKRSTVTKCLVSAGDRSA